MDLLVVAQIITGLATLIVAFVLVFQLRKQTQQLTIQHKDSISNSINQFKSRFEDITKETVSDSEFADIWVKGSKDWNNLKSDSERYRFKNHYRQYFNWILDQFKLRDEGVLDIPEEQIIHQGRNMVGVKGFAHCYKNYFKRGLRAYPDVMKIWDDIYLEIYDEDISTFIPKQITSTRFD